MLATLVLHETEWSRADRRKVQRILPDVAVVLVKVLWRNVAKIRQRAQQQVQRHRPLVAKDRRIGVRRIDRSEEELQRGAVIEDLLPHVHRRIGDIGGGEWLAVMPGDALAQPECAGLAVRRGLPAFRQHADRLAGGVKVDQRLLDLSADDVDAGRSLQARIKLALLGAVVNREDTALARR